MVTGSCESYRGRGFHGRYRGGRRDCCFLRGGGSPPASHIRNLVFRRTQVPRLGKVERLPRTLRCVRRGRPLPAPAPKEIRRVIRGLEISSEWHLPELLRTASRGIEEQERLGNEREQMLFARLGWIEPEATRERPALQRHRCATRIAGDALPGLRWQLRRTMKSTKIDHLFQPEITRRVRPHPLPRHLPQNLRRGRRVRQFVRFADQVMRKVVRPARVIRPGISRAAQDMETGAAQAHNAVGIHHRARRPGRAPGAVVLAEAFDRGDQPVADFPMPGDGAKSGTPGDQSARGARVDQLPGHRCISSGGYEKAGTSDGATFDSAQSEGISM